MAESIFFVDNRCLLRVSGADAERYLNGQLTVNVPALESGRAAAACILTAKGKLVADLLVWRESADGFFLEAAAVVRDVLAARIDRYLVADDVTVEDRGSHAFALHFLGKSPEAEVMACVRVGESGWDRRFSSDASRRRAADEAVAAGWQLLDPDAVERLRISRMIPAWGKELDENVLPAEAGLDAVAVDFHKGCYVGQEVVSRIHSVGRVNRRLRLLRVVEGELSVPGAALIERDSGDSVGAVTSIAPGGDGEKLALGFVRWKSAEPGVRLCVAESDSDCVVEVCKPPAVV